MSANFRRLGVVVIAFLGQEILGRVRDLDRYLHLDQVLLQLLQLQIDDLPDLRGGQALEDHHGVDSVEEFWAEHPLQLLVDLFLGVLVPALDLFLLVDHGRLETK